MKKQTIAYWVTTTLTGLAFAGGGFADLMGSPDIVSAMTHLGYPAYVAPILGVWKLLGVVAILAPGLPRPKEWAYAGMFFDLTGAAMSHAVLADGASAVLTPLLLLGLVLSSWALRPDSRKLESGSARMHRSDARADATLASRPGMILARADIKS